MRFWDASALVPLLVDDPRSASLRARLREDSAVVVWWATAVECASAIARWRREGRLPEAGEIEAARRLAEAAGGWREVSPTSEVREAALRMLHVHVLRASDALQLGAALVACDRRPAALDMVCLDDRFAQAARREGFQVLA